MKIAIITPMKQQDYLANTVLDGLIVLKEKQSDIEWCISSKYPCPFPVVQYYRPISEFIEYAKSADYIFFIWGNDGNTDFKTAYKVNRWARTVFIDGSEVGGNLRFDFNIQMKILHGKYKKRGEIIPEMFEKCLLYCRREKPYFERILPLPFGIESRYHQFSNVVEKDIDFVCVFGSDDSPLLRRHSITILNDFCKKNGLSCFTGRTSNQDEFYKLLSRAKVGVSIGGGGYDTARFWEILGNRCILLTETIDIFPVTSDALNFNSIIQFNNAYDFLDRLEQMKTILKDSESVNRLLSDYPKIIEKHSTSARVQSIFNRLTELTNN